MNLREHIVKTPLRALKLTLLLLLLACASSSAQGLKGIELPGLETIRTSKKLLGFKQPKPIKIDTFLSHTSIQSHDKFGLLIRFTMNDDWHIYGREEQIGTPTTIRLLSDEFAISREILSPSTRNESGEGDSKVVSHWLADQSYLFAEIKLKDNLVLAPSLSLKLEVIFQPCTQTSCLMVQTEEVTLPINFGQTKRVQAQKWMKDTPEFLSLVKPSLEPPLSNPSKSQELILDQGFLAVLISAFLWGLLASLTPCVYPMIPITVSLFSDPNNHKNSSRILPALFYVLGIALSYATLGMIASYSGRDLGSWLANPYVAGLLALIMVLMALSMFGLFELDLPDKFKEKLTRIEGTRPVTLFFMGTVMGFIAAPCVGPFFGAIMIWLVKNPGQPIFGFLMMLAFGLGLGTLFLVVALFSQAILPKSGQWMVTLKKMMGYVLLGMALYFMEVFLDARSMSIAWGLYLVVAGSLIGAFVSLNWEDPWWKKIARGLGIVIFLWGLIKIFQYPGTSFIAPNEKSSQNSSQGFYENHENTLREALKQKKPVFLYFGAKWCIPCKRIKEVVLKDSRIKKELQRFVVGVLDCTMADSHGAEIKKEVYNSPSMPFFAFHASDGTHLKDLDIHKAVEAEELLTVLQKVR